MQAQLPIEIRVACDKAAAEDLYMLDLWSFAEGVSDDVYAGAAAVTNMARVRFEQHLRHVPRALMAQAMDYIDRKVDQMMLNRHERAQRKKAQAI